MPDRCDSDALQGWRVGIASTFATRFGSRRTRLLAAAYDWQVRSLLPESFNSHGTQLESIMPVSADSAIVPAIDMRSITQLAEGDELGAQFIVNIIDVFLADLSKRVSAIGSQISQGDRAGVAATAHAIKGSCGHFGAVRLIKLSSDLETRAKREPAEDLQVAIISMVAETERVRTALEAYRFEYAQP